MIDINNDRTAIAKYDSLQEIKRSKVAANMTDGNIDKIGKMGINDNSPFVKP